MQKLRTKMEIKSKENKYYRDTIWKNVKRKEELMDYTEDQYEGKNLFSLIDLSPQGKIGMEVEGSKGYKITQMQTIVKTMSKHN